MRVRFHAAFALIALTVGGAGDAPPTVRTTEASPADSVTIRARQDSIVRSRPGYVIDSILPVEEEIRRFQATLGTAPQGFSGGERSRAALIDAFLRSLEQRDTTGLWGLVVNRPEFGFLIYPTSPNARPPYRQSPELVWLQRSAASDKGARRLLARFAGRPLGHRGVTCPTAGSVEGNNVIWSGCAVRLVSPETGAMSSLRLFGPIVQRGRTFKFLSLSNGL
jgi:hypothetical protein